MNRFREILNSTYTEQQIADEWERRKRLIVIANCTYWRAASALPFYKAYCDACFNYARAGYVSHDSEGEYTPEVWELDLGAGYVFHIYAQTLPEWAAYWKAQDFRNAISAALLRRNLAAAGIKL